MKKYIKRQHGNALSKIHNVGNSTHKYCRGFFFQQKKIEGKRDSEEDDKWT